MGYDEFFIFRILPMLLNGIYDGADGDMDIEDGYAELPRDIGEYTAEIRAAAAAAEERLPQQTETVSPDSAAVSENRYESGVYLRSGDIRNIYGGGDRYESIRLENTYGDVYPTAENTLRERHSEIYRERETVSESVFRSLYGEKTRLERENTARERTETDRLFSLRETERSGACIPTGGRSDTVFEKRLAADIASAGGRTENRNEHRELVVNIGGITQNITGGGTEELYDIGEAVARCLADAINTTAEGAF